MLFVVAKRVLEQVKQLAEREGIGISILLEKDKDSSFDPYLQDDYAYVRVGDGGVENSFNFLRTLLANLNPGDFVVYLSTSTSFLPYKEIEAFWRGVTTLEGGEGRTE